jgi:hypothetical protein
MMIALTLLGCTTWIDQEPACDQDVYYWSDDALAHVLTGDGSGEFEYDPEDEPRTAITGAYDPATGDFEWEEEYDSEYYIKDAEVEGFGTLYHSGNLDLLYTRTVTDMLDEVVSTVFRVQRNGCNMTIASWDAEGDVDDAFVRTGTYEDEEVWEWEADYPGYSWRGSMRKTLLRTEQIEADDGSYWSFTSTKPDGETTQEWTGACGDYYCEGEATRFYGGRLNESYEAFDGDESVYTFQGAYDYAGNGEARVDYDGGPSCELTYEEWECTYECDDGTDGDC